MRIIAGEFRGRKLLPPESDTTRPITDRVKQSLFDIVTPLLPDARIYDCFAGTGSMGLESLSRSASHATFFETDRSALARLKKNIDALQVGNRAAIVPTDLFRWFDNAPPLPDSQHIGLIFLDPPYRFLRERADDLKRLVERMAANHLAKDGTIVFRHDSADHLALPAVELYDAREYGGMTIELLRRAVNVP